MKLSCRWTLTHTVNGRISQIEMTHPLTPATAVESPPFQDNGCCRDYCHQADLGLSPTQSPGVSKAS